MLFGTLHLSMMSLLPYSTCLLIINRIYCISSIKFNKYEHYTCYLNIPILCVIFLAYFLYILYTILNPTKLLNLDHCGFACRIYSNISTLQIIKVFMGLLNTVLSIYFAIVFFKYLKRRSRERQRVCFLTFSKLTL